jgi:mRNA interferase MazF
VRRGEVWWAKLPDQAGPRPVLLLSRDEAYEVRAVVRVAALTTRIRGMPVEVQLGPDDGMPRACVVDLDALTTIPKDSLSEPLATLSPRRMSAVDSALRFSLGLDA